MSEQVYWRAGWYATRLHALGQMGEDERLLALCGAMVFRSGPPCDWAKRRMSKGIPKCKRCLKMLGELDQSDLDAAWAWFRGSGDALYHYPLGEMRVVCEWRDADDLSLTKSRLGADNDAAVLAAWRAATGEN